MKPSVQGVLERRSSVAGLLAALVLGACGGGGPSSGALSFPAPEVPPLVLAAARGGPTAPARVCIEQDFGVLFVPVDELAAALTAIGIEVATSGCDASIRFEGTAERSSARYQPGRTCYEGWKVDGAMTWEIGGQAMGRWPISAERAAPQWIEVCHASDAAITLPASTFRFGQVLVELFRDAGFAAAVVHGTADSTIGVQPGAFEKSVDVQDAFDDVVLPPDPAALSAAELDGAVARTADGLHRAKSSNARDWIAYRVLWLSKQPCCLPTTRVLEPLVPYLIEGLAPEQSPDSTDVRHLMTVLRRLTSESFDSSDAWLDWWRRGH
jgi:hypothetical protein